MTPSIDDGAKITGLAALSQGTPLAGVPKFKNFETQREYMLNHMAGAFRVSARHGFVEGMAGHISMRDPENPDLFWTNPDEWRTLHGMFFTRGIYRQEENIYLANSAGEVLRWSPKAQKALGYELSSPNIGFVEFKTPIQYLRGADVDAFGNFDPSQEKEA
ncbi:hypothetical protein N7501_002664 [Penicillium viridicatum]|nr:hypothetical protein N7501_002664 [Penicillium viridicatum]